MNLKKDIHVLKWKTGQYLYILHMYQLGRQTYFKRDSDSSQNKTKSRNNVRSRYLNFCVISTSTSNYIERDRIMFLSMKHTQEHLHTCDSPSSYALAHSAIQIQQLYDFNNNMMRTCRYLLYLSLVCSFLKQRIWQN